MVENKFVKIHYDTSNILEAVGTNQCVINVNSFGIETITLTLINRTLQCRIWMDSDSIIRLPPGIELPNSFNCEILGNVAILRIDQPEEVGRATEQIISMMNLIDVVSNFNAKGEKPKEPIILRLEFQKERIGRKTMTAALNLLLKSDAVGRLREEHSRRRIRGFVPSR